MALTAMWIHGNALIPEFPNSLESITRRGFGTELTIPRGAGVLWFHVPMPSPVFLAGVRPKLRRVILLCQSGNLGVSITRVHIFDGNDRVQDHPGLFGGDLSRPSVIETGQQPIVKALGISMQLPSADQRFSFFFAGFGADWE